MFLYYELFEQFMQHLHSETRYQTNKITNIFHRETLCTPFIVKYINQCPQNVSQI